MRLNPKLQEKFEATRPKKLKKYKLMDIATRGDEAKAIALWFGDDPDFPMLSIIELDGNNQRVLNADLVGLPVRIVIWPNENDVFQLADVINGVTSYTIDKYNAIFNTKVPPTEGNVVWALDPCSLPRLEWTRYRGFENGKFEKINKTGLHYESDFTITSVEELAKSDKNIIYPCTDIESAQEILGNSFSSFKTMAENLALPTDEDDDSVWSKYFGKSRSDITETDIEVQRLWLENLVSMGDDAREKAKKYFEQLIESDVAPPHCGDAIEDITGAIDECSKIDYDGF